MICAVREDEWNKRGEGKGRFYGRVDVQVLILKCTGQVREMPLVELRCGRQVRFSRLQPRARRIEFEPGV